MIEAYILPKGFLFLFFDFIYSRMSEFYWVQVASFYVSIIIAVYKHGESKF